jgi:DEAD/DEAH box helicase domain-containing protein
VLSRLLSDVGARAMCRSPTKALAEDQLHELACALEFMSSELRYLHPRCDTPQDARKAIRQRGNIELTNPDMPHHTRWARYFENLRSVVID